MRKRRILGALTAVMLLLTSSAPAAFAAAPAPKVTYEMSGTETSAELSLGGLTANIYSVQLRFTATGRSNLTFEPEDSEWVYKLEEKTDDTTVLYLDSKVPLNSTSDTKTAVLGSLHSDTAFKLENSGELTTLDVSLVPAGPTAVTISKKGDNGGGSGGGGGGGSHSGGSSGSSVTQTEGVTNVTVPSGGQTVVGKDALSSAQTLAVKGDASLELNNSAVVMLRSLGKDVTIRSAAVKPSDEGRVVQAQLAGGSGLYTVSVQADGSEVTLPDGSVRVSVPFAGTGKPVAYQLNDSGLMTRIGSAERSGDTASFTAPALSGGRLVVLDVVHNFFDVNDWYDGYVNTVVNAKVMSGMGSGSFQPSKSMTRAELVTTLANLSGASLPASASFSDVSADDWFAPYVGWAQQNGITSGITPTEFMPNREITREQMAVMLVKFVQDTMKKSLTLDQQAVAFSDSAQISDYAKEAMSLMQRSGIIGGKSNNMADPQGLATRGECAKMLSMVLLELNK